MMPVKVTWRTSGASNEEPWTLSFGILRNRPADEEPEKPLEEKQKPITETKGKCSNAKTRSQRG
jgi:hypothetical protein